MTELAFIVKEGSDMYKNYMDQKNENEKFHELAYNFFKKHDVGGGNQYFIQERLAVELDDEHIEKYSSQLMKDRGDGFSRFKLSSAMQKEWEKEVVSKCDKKKLHCNMAWYFPFIQKGRYSMWDTAGTVYGYLSSNSGEIKICDDMEPIKLSEYYKIIEQLEDENCD